MSRGKQKDYTQWLSSNTLSSIGSYSIGKTVGEGTFGKVKLGYHLYTGQPVAIKIVDKIHAPSVAREIETWRHLRHHNIVQLYEVICSETKIFMVTEYCSGGEMLDYIVKNGRLDDTQLDTKKIFWQIVDGIRFCHDKNYVHRDLKLENILLDKDLQVKIIDFGFTRPVDQNKLLDTFCGSIAYAAPEILAAKKYSGKLADIWSLGIILFTIVCGHLPFDEDDETDMHKKIAEMEFQIPEFLQNDTVDLLNTMLVLDPLKRLRAIDIQDHVWFLPLKEHDPQISNLYKGSGDTLFTSPDTTRIIHHLNALGFDSKVILNSVKNDGCDSLSALWYLLKQKYTQIHQNNPETVPELDHQLVSEVNALSLTPKSTQPFITGSDLSTLPVAVESVRKNTWMKEGSSFSPESNYVPKARKHSLHRMVELEEETRTRPSSAGAVISRSSTKKKTVIEEEDEF